MAVRANMLRDGARFPTHTHPFHQFAWASRGVLTLGAAGRTWVLPRARGLWIPAGVDHDVLASAPVNMVSLYLDPGTCPIGFCEPTVIDTSGLLGQLIEYLATDLRPDARARAEAVMFDLVSPLPAATVHVPAPVDDRARRVAGLLARDPADQRTLVQWGRTVGASGRTLARAFKHDTDMTFATWRTHLRIAASLSRLAAGAPIHQVASEVGYSTPSAFVAAFRRTVGTTPGHYFD
ncbi:MULTISPECIES: AraC family transcriptional regulator [unclassified Spirillospora]|uniref:AraC family transcriptional regulator n=1 Tax=unclassified Spirillospora TaxID=2642701 RepID=UPI00371483CB